MKTVKEISEITGKSKDTIIRKIKKLFPNLDTGRGSKIYLEDIQAAEIIKSLLINFENHCKIKHFLEKSRKDAVLFNNNNENKDNISQENFNIIYEKIGKAIQNISKKEKSLLPFDNSRHFISYLKDNKDSIKECIIKPLVREVIEENYFTIIPNEFSIKQLIKEEMNYIYEVVNNIHIDIKKLLQDKNNK